MHLRILLKVHLKKQADAKFGPLKREGKGETFNAAGDAQESANGTTINPFETALDSTIEGAPQNISESALSEALQDLNKDAQKGAFEVVLKGVLEVALELHLFMHLSMHKIAQNGSIKCQLEATVYVALEEASKISL